jgi:hypothetical protein
MRKSPQETTTSPGAGVPYDGKPASPTVTGTSSFSGSEKVRLLHPPPPPLPPSRRPAPPPKFPAVKSKRFILQCAMYRYGKTENIKKIGFSEKNKTKKKTWATGYKANSDFGYMNILTGQISTQIVYTDQKTLRLETEFRKDVIDVHQCLSLRSADDKLFSINL